MTTIKLNPDQSRILNWRVKSGGVAGVIGPAGCGKTTTGSFLAVKMICEGYAKNCTLSCLYQFGCQRIRKRVEYGFRS